MFGPESIGFQIVRIKEGIMPSVNSKLVQLVRRSKLFVPVNRENFVAKAWTRGADCIILDLEDAIAPPDKASARKLVKDVIPLVNQGGAEVQVRINREFEAEDLEAIVVPGLNGVMIPKAETVDGIQRIDQMVTQLEKERGLPGGKIYFDLIVETALGVVDIEHIAKASPRIEQMNIGQGDLSVDMGFPRFMELNFEQYFYAENKLLYAARAAGVQACSLGAQNGVDFTSVSMGPEAMLQACRHALWMGFLGAIIIHPGWVNSVNEGFKPPQKDLDMARKVKATLEEAYAQGKGSVTVDGRMYDVANMKHVNYILERAGAIERREAEKTAALKAVKGDR
jgi:citrate lyase subunit beta / citryl-CoA lyase